MNLKKIAIVSACTFASLNPVVADESEGLGGLFETLGFVGGQFFEVFGDTFVTGIAGVAEIFEDAVENGFNVGNIIESLVEIGINVVAEVVTAVTNVGFALLGPQFSALIQDLVAGFFPLEVTGFLDGDLALLVTDVTTDECSTEFNVSFTKNLIMLSGPEDIGINDLVFLENTYDDGNFDAVIEMELSGFSVVLTTEGDLYGMDCNSDDTVPYTAVVTVKDVKVGAKFGLSAFVEGSNFTANAIDVQSVTYEDAMKEVTAEAPDSDGDKVTIALEEHFKEIILDEYFSIFEDSVSNVTLINTLIADNGLLPYVQELPFEWPL